MAIFANITTYFDVSSCIIGLWRMMYNSTELEFQDSWSLSRQFYIYCTLTAEGLSGGPNQLRVVHQVSAKLYVWHAFTKHYRDFYYNQNLQVRHTKDLASNYVLRGAITTPINCIILETLSSYHFWACHLNWLMHTEWLHQEITYLIMPSQRCLSLRRSRRWVFWISSTWSWTERNPA